MIQAELHGGKPIVVESVEITDEMVERATEGIVQAHQDEIRAFLEGKVPANQWRPEVYAKAALTAALATTQRGEGTGS